MARGLPVGGSRSGLVCPSCHGGQSRERSLSVYRTEFGVGGRCHRAKCSLNIFRRTVDTGPVEAPVFKPRPYPYPLAVPARDHFLWDLLRVAAADRSPGLAARLGALTRADDANEVVWEVRDYQWLTRGHISRSYPDKRIRVWRTTEGPFYAYHGADRTRSLWLVEDSISAAQVALAGGNALALLGTHLSREGQRELAGYLNRLATVVGTPLVKVALDPDAMEVGARLARELTSRIGCATMFVPLVADPKDLPEGELARMVRDE
jgi:hypothetical protein